MYLSLFYIISQALNLPIGLLDSMCYVESTHKANIISYKDGNNEDSLGICQIKLSAAKHIGFKGTRKQLLRPENNILWAGKYLQYQHKRYRQWNKAVIAYNQGHCLKTQQTSQYWRKVKKVWKNVDNRTQNQTLLKRDYP